MTTAALKLDRVRRAYGAVLAVDDVTLEATKGEFLTLLGPSGSGKTSTLRLIGGFEPVDDGEIWINGARAEHLPPYKRDTATIFQSGALFTHMTVVENLAFGLRMRRVPRAEADQRIKEVLDVVRLGGFEERYPEQLSGGQRQRVALARSLIVRPTVLLFDEPLSALDLSLRVQLRAEIKRLHDDLGFSAIYVTHDQGEAMAMSDRVAVMNKGRIEQIGHPETIFNAASNEFVHTFVGESSCLSVLVDSGAIRDSGGLPLDLTLADPLAEGAHRIYLRPTHIRLGSAARNMPNKLSATLSFVEFLGETRRFHLRAGTSELIADQTDMPEVGPGEPLEIGWESSVMRVFR